MQYFNNKKGTTLVELIVAFALAAIFMTTAVALITPFTNVYMRILNMNRIHDMSDVVMEKVVDELTYATAIDWGSPVEGAEGYYASIGYQDKSGNSITSMKSDPSKGLMICYGKITNPEEGNTITDSSEWTFGSNGDFYKGNTVELKFAKVPGKNQIHVFLKIASKDKDGKEIYSQKSERYVECIDVTK